MNLSARTINLALCLFTFTLLAALGCASAGGQTGAGSKLSPGPPVIIPEYEGREPRKCASMTKPPSVSEATVMVQCTMDARSPFGLGLVQDVKIEMGASRPFVYNSDAGLSGIDLKAQVYPLRGSYTGYLCQHISNMAPAGQSCTTSEVSEAVGWCWKTSFGDYKCKLQGAPGGSLKMGKGAAPTTY